MAETYEHLERRCNRYGCELERLYKLLRELIIATRKADMWLKHYVTDGQKKSDGVLASAYERERKDLLAEIENFIPEEK